MKPVIVTTPTCGPCKELKAWLVENGVDADVFEIGTLEGDTLAETHDIMTVPTIIIGEDVFRGRSPEVLKLLLESKRVVTGE